MVSTSYGCQVLNYYFIWKRVFFVNFSIYGCHLADLEPHPSFAEIRPGLLLQLTTTEPFPATAISPAQRGPCAILLEDSVPAGSTLSGGSATNVPLDTMDFPTANVNDF